jgi:NADH-quinone oxidoreductase subunit A
MGGYALGVIAEFTIPFLIAFVWLISQGGLDWGPVRRVRRFAVADASGPPGTTVLRVGLEGREL